ncbi:hypothetical protein QYE88_42385, partial [Enterobacter hormaechei subsp. steigerwaltii]|nr:hypothetical protein [Enterobacter hormaechei subsp. steigerwaltii]
GKSPLRGAFGLFLPAYRGRAEVTSLRLAPAYRKRLSDLQPDRGIAESPEKNIVALKPSGCQRKIGID